MSAAAVVGADVARFGPAQHPRWPVAAAVLIVLPSGGVHTVVVDIGPPELLIVLVLVVVLFGADRLPKLARSLGRAHREFRAGLSGAPDQPGGAAPAATELGPVPSAGERGSIG
jgi:TatA/E family protein of Tat protein translocase